ncbi:MAG TPA: branched-chain amino acid transaminase [Candidatus Limnocylindria bacterium]|nr:branched-chain amino acid transaminase [Candidatus Limnocylindria bacterium]
MSAPTESKRVVVKAQATAPARASSAPPTASSAEGSDGKRLAIGEWAYFEGRLVPFAQATVSIATHAFNYGTAIFEGIRAYRQADGGLALLFGLEHYRRLLRNGRLLRASVPETAEQLVEITSEMLRRNGVVADLYIRPLLYKSAPSIRLQLTGLDDRVSIFSFPLGDYVPTEGLRVQMSAWQRVNDNAVPARGKITGSYVNACLAVEDAKAGGYTEALLLNADGHVAEASSANLFVVQGGVLATPPLSDDVLPGITRECVIGLARDLGYTVEERSVDRTELYTSDEVFLTGTGVQIAAIASIDDRPVGEPGAGSPVTAALQKAYFAAVRGLDPRYAHWLTPVEGV